VRRAPCRVVRSCIAYILLATRVRTLPRPVGPW
jgi:hypothetical protein